jgi:hypothetical protein
VGVPKKMLNKGRQNCQKMDKILWIFLSVPRYNIAGLSLNVVLKWD